MATVVVTGANRGIGLALVRSYLDRGDKVVALCRNSSDELNDTGATIIDKVDLSNPDALPQALARLHNDHIDVLINNAGVWADESLDQWSPHTIEHQFLVNAMGPLLVTQLLLDKFKAGSKIALITSRMGSIADNGSGGRYGYRMSKAALNAAGKSMALDLQSKEVAVAILHPGFVQTDMVGGRGDISAEVCAQRLVQRIDELSLDNSGTFWHSNGEVLPW